MNEWISVKERLPKELRQQVLVIDKEGTMAIGVLVNKDTSYFDSYCSQDITHWMPLPEPPKEGKREITNFEKIKNMGIKEVAEFFDALAENDICLNPKCNDCDQCMFDAWCDYGHRKSIEWLKSTAKDR